MSSRLMMFEGKHIHFSPVDKKPLCSYSAKLCKQRRINGYAFCIRHILEDKSSPFKQCAHVARYNKQKCTNPIPSNEHREFCNSHMQVAGMLPKKERKSKKEKDKELFIPCDGKLKFADRLRALLKKENSISCNDDPFNSDDPYAFTDPVSEQENGCIGFSATPILRTAWSCSQKPCDSTYSDAFSKNEPFTKSSSPPDSKMKSNTPKLSKTMNRLHAKIAQNKILDKQKKTQDSSQSTIGLISSNFHPVVNNIKIEPLSPVENNSVSNESGDLKLLPSLIKLEPIIISKSEPSVEDIKSEITMTAKTTTIETTSTNTAISPYSASNSVELMPSRVDSVISSGSASIPEKSPCPSNSSTKEIFDCIKMKVEESVSIPAELKTLLRILKEKRSRNDDLFPSVYESSESEASDSDEESGIHNRLSSFCTWDRRSSDAIQNRGDNSSRKLKQMQLKYELQKSYRRLCRLNELHKQEISSRRDLIKPLIASVRKYPNYSTDALVKYMKSFRNTKVDVLVKRTHKRTCSHKENSAVCSSPALPYTWHCQKHIMYNVDQLLFQHCTAKYPDNTQCCVPVFDVINESPLCTEHAKKRDNCHKMAMEPKPKKPRKKPKPSALTRPPKRGKKKKKPNLLRPFSPSVPLPQQPLHSIASTSIDAEIQVSGHLSYCSQTLKPVFQAQSITKCNKVQTGNMNNSVHLLAANLRKENPDATEAINKSNLLHSGNIHRDFSGQIDAELESDLEDHFSPGSIEKSLDLPLDAAELANQATKLLEENDFTEVLNKIPDDAFNDLFVENRNGEYIPTKEETEELERALAAVSKDVHLAKESLAKLSSGTGPDLEELERSIEIHGSLLGAENLTSAIDENTFPELTNSLNVITSSFTTNDFNSLTQALSSIDAENIEQNNLPVVSGSHIIPNSIATVPLLTSDVTYPHMLNGHTAVAGLHPLHVDHNFTPHILENNLNPATHDCSAEGRLIGNNHLATIFFGFGHTATACPQTFANGGNISDDAGLMSTPGGLTSTHWLLNSSDQVLALSHMAYQNGFVVTSQGNNTQYTSTPLIASVGKYPLQSLSAEVSLVSSNSPLVTSASCSDNVVCASTEQLPNRHNSSRISMSLPQNSSTKVIAQEGAS